MPKSKTHLQCSQNKRIFGIPKPDGREKTVPFEVVRNYIKSFPKVSSHYAEFLLQKNTWIPN